MPPSTPTGSAHSRRACDRAVQAGAAVAYAARPRAGPPGRARAPRCRRSPLRRAPTLGSVACLRGEMACAAWCLALELSLPFGLPAPFRPAPGCVLGPELDRPPRRGPAGTGIWMAPSTDVLSCPGAAAGASRLLGGDRAFRRHAAAPRLRRSAPARFTAANNASKEPHLFGTCGSRAARISSSETTTTPTGRTSSCSSRVIVSRARARSALPRPPAALAARSGPACAAVA
jgi:hypothetical protein